MGQEATKANNRRSKHSEYAEKYLVGNGIDIGAGDDCVGRYTDLYTKILSCRNWDIPDGDAQYLESVPDNTYDFVHSSHCLEHMVDPLIAMRNWIRVLKPGGHAVIIIPDEDLYEQGVFPSTFNGDHKWTFTIHKNGKSWSKQYSHNVLELICLLHDCKPISVRLNEEYFDFEAPRYDQTGGPAECSIEFIVRKM